MLAALVNASDAPLGELLRSLASGLVFSGQIMGLVFSRLVMLLTYLLAKSRALEATAFTLELLACHVVFLPSFPKRSPLMMC